MEMARRTRRLSLSLVALVLVISAAVYLPGISGPYVFDDRQNLLQNSFLRIDSLEPEALRRASFSLASGPLLRPLSMLSFALNYYFAGSFDQTTPFKLTNLAIHVINGLLIFWLMRLIFARLSHMGGTSDPVVFAGLTKNESLAAAVTLLWVVHPINLTSVLYIVQRMASLSALFTLLGLIVYLKGRNLLVAGRATGIGLMAIGILGFGTLGLLCKENAALLPVFVLALELTLFADQAPWRYWPRLSARTRGAILTALLVIAIGVLVWAINLFMPSYAVRDFNMSERLLTESRVLIFYLSLILLPRINAFGLHHDDILLSTSLIAPWTTLPAILGLIGLLVWAYLARKKLPLLTLGIFWFFVGNSLESTIIPLEITHEHRNYLAGVGILLALICLLDYGHRKFNRKVWIVYAVFAAILVGTTVLRATQWSDYNSLTRYQAIHHPNSARAQGMLSSLLYAQSDYEQAMTAIQRAAALKPDEPGYKINMHVLALRLGIPLSPSVHEDILKLLSYRPPSAFTQMSLNYVVSCIATDCSKLQSQIEAWLRTLIENLSPGVDSSFFDYQLGRALIAQGKVLDGLTTLEKASRIDPNYLHPLFELANVFLSLRQIENAELILERIRKANEGNLHPREKEIAELETAIERLKNEARERSQDRS